MLVPSLVIVQVSTEYAPPENPILLAKLRPETVNWGSPSKSKEASRGLGFFFRGLGFFF